jgi:hypothetical protein
MEWLSAFLAEGSQQLVARASRLLSRERPAPASGMRQRAGCPRSHLRLFLRLALMDRFTIASGRHRA